MTVPFAGYYTLDFWGSFKIASINNFIGVKFAVNSTLSTQKVVTQSSTANDIKSLTAMSIIGPLAANDAISLYIAGTIGTNVTLQDAGLLIRYLHA